MGTAKNLDEKNRLIHILISLAAIGLFIMLVCLAGMRHDDDIRRIKNVKVEMLYETKLFSERNLSRQIQAYLNENPGNSIVTILPKYDVDSRIIVGYYVQFKRGM